MISSDVRSTRSASRIVTVPDPSSSAPGAEKMEGRKRLMLSWCAPTTTVELLFPGMVAMMLFCPQGCLKCFAKAPCLSAPESEIVFCTFCRSHSEDWRP